ncbi:hypothetical protein ACHWQZ_G008998 [Mnemiopsis leidyi]
MGRKVEELDFETQELLKASVAIPSLAILVQELVCNSIDSGATCIAVRVNIERNSRVQVVDNGHGVQDIVELCEHAPTHKRKVSRHLYGTRRGSLYYIIKLCEKVVVTTRRHNTTVTKVYTSYNEREVVTEKRNRHSKGTTITVDNVFSNMPVRSASVSYMDMEETKDSLLRLAVANPNVAITLKDINSGTKLFQTHSSSTSSDNFLLFCHHIVDWRSLSEVRFEINGYRLKALLSNQLYPKPRQLVYVNRRHVSDERIMRFANDLLTSALAPLDKKNQENRFPVFLFFIACKPINVDMCFDSNTFLEFSDWDSVFTLVYRCISSFLEAEEIPFNVTEESLSQLSSPCPSLQTLLRVTSPVHNVKSEKALRVRNSSSLAPPTEIISNESGEVEKFSFVSEKPNTKKLVEETVLETPKKTNHSKLQNAPILNHLEGSSKNIEPTGSKTIEKSSVFSRNNGQSFYPSPGFQSTKRRSSTPLCPSKSATLQLNISPIDLPKKHKGFLTPSVQTKRKRSQRSSTSNISKKRDLKSGTCNEKPEKDQPIFHLETPRFILDGQSSYLSSEKHSSRTNLFRHSKDSGYQTTSRDGFSAFPLFEPSKLFGSLSSEQDLSKCEMELYSDYDETSSLEPKRAQLFEVFEDATNSPTNVKSNKKQELSPHRFKIYWDNADGFDKKCNDKDMISLVRKIPTNHVNDVSKDAMEKVANNSIISQKKVHKVKMLDSACSPIKIPVDRGCSPVNFESANSDSLPEKSAENQDVMVQLFNLKTTFEKDLSCDSFSDIDESVLAGVDRKIDELVGSSSREIDNCAGKVDIANIPIKSPCFECHTQNVMKRLDFASQSRTKDTEDLANKENIRPDYKVVTPVTAASHLVSNFAPWNKSGPKITITKKSAPLDIRKWNSSVFETHGDGAWNVQKNPKLNMKFLLDAQKFDKGVFDGIKVIGQIDEKFIGCVTSKNLLILIDQHAAHERIRLECMLDTVHKDRDTAGDVEDKKLITPIPMKLSKADTAFVNHISSKLKRVGFEIDCSKNHINIISIPAICFTESDNLNISIDDIITAFSQTVQQIRDSKGCNLSLPTKLVDYLHSKACHGAIRFGDELTEEQCRVLVKQLSACDLPFQCAHGRPSFAPIVTLVKDRENEFEVADVEPVCQELRFLKLRSRFRPT